MEVIKHTFSSLKMNLRWFIFFSIPLLLALLIPLFSPLPTYISTGGTFLRTGSIPTMSQLELGIVIIAFLLSTMLISIALVSINIIIKHKRTFTKIPKEVIDGIENYTFSLFWLIVASQILYFVVYLLAYEYSLQDVLSPLFSFIVSLFLFYAPAAIVIDDMRPLRALQASFKHIMKKPTLFIIWVLIAAVLLIVPDAILIILKNSIPYARYVLLVLNALLLLPFLIVLQTQMYLTKYAILK